MSRLEDASDRKSLRATAIVLAIALLAHLALAWQYVDDPFFEGHVGDALSYHEWAARLADGTVDEPVFHQAPGFPYLLGAVYALFEPAARGRAALALQAVLTSLALALLVPLGCLALGSRAVGIAAATLALFCTPFLYYSTKLFPTPLALLTQALALLALLAARRRPTGLRAALAGGATGLAITVRPEMLLFVPVLLLALLRPAAPWPGRSRAAGLAACLAALVLLVAPVTAYNLRRGDLVLVASSAGENLFIGNQREATGGHRALHPQAGDLVSQRRLATLIAEQQAGRSLKPSEVSRYWGGRAFSEVAADPLRWLGLEARKLARLVAFDPTDLYSLRLERTTYLPLLYLFPLPAAALLLLAASGGVLALRGRQVAAWPLAGLAAIQLAVLLGFFVNARLRLPLLYAIAPFAGLALVRAVRAWRAGRHRRLLAAAGVGLALLTVAASVSPPHPRDVIRLAAILSTQQRLDDSLRVLGPLIDGAKPDAVALDQAGWVLEKQGHTDAAIERYRLALDTGLPERRARQTRTRLGHALERVGRIDEAATAHERAASSPTADAGTFYERGMFLLRQGRRRDAIADLRRAASLDPAWPPPREALRALVDP